MANSLGTIQQATLILQRALTLTFARFPQLRTFCKGFTNQDGSVEQAQLGQVVYTRKLGASTVGNFGDSAADFSATDVTGRLRNFPQVYHKFTMEEINKSGNQNLMDMIALPVGLKIAQAITERVAKLVNRANFGATVNSVPSFLEVASAWTRANTILAMKTACDDRGIPENFVVPTINGLAGQTANRFFVVNSSVESALLGDTMIVSQHNNPVNAEAIKNGRLPMVDGFEFAKYSSLPNVDGNLIGFAGCADALAYMARAPLTPWDVMPDLPKTAIFKIVRDPTTGFQMLIIIEGKVGTLDLGMRIIWLDGLEVVNSDLLVRLVSGAIAGTSGTIVGLTATNSGYGYRNGSGAYAAPTVTISGGGGTGATATATISTNGAITGFTITDAGSGYTSPPTITLTPSTSGGAGSVVAPATAVATVGGLK